MSVDNMRSIVLLLCTCIANFRFYKPSFPYCARLCWIKKWQQQQPESVLKNLLKINRPKVFDNDWKQQPAWCCQLSVVTLPFPFSIPITAVPSDTSLPSVFMQNQTLMSWPHQPRTSAHSAYMILINPRQSQPPHQMIDSTN